MLRSTFLHLPGIGPVREQRLWAAGLRTWEEAAAREPDSPLGQGARESLQRWAAGDWTYFDRALPAPEKWRVFAALEARALYLDIETDGTDFVTVLGAFDGHTCRQFVAGRDLDQALAYLESFPLVVTFNGAQFDLPVLRRHFRRARFNHVHLDLRFPLHRLGYRGGLKRIEEQLGLVRGAETRGLDGWAAVRLWHQWRQGDPAAGRRLLAYNAEDICHLQPLARLVWREMTARVKVPA